MRRNRLFGMLAVLIVFGLAGLGLPGLAAQEAAQTINIGVIGASDGSTAQGVSLAIEQANAIGPAILPDGRSYRFAVVFASARTPDEVSAVAARMAEVNVAAIFGPDDDALAVESAAALSAVGVPTFIGATTSDLPAEGGRFRTQSPDRVQLAALAAFLGGDLGAVRIAIFQGGEAFASPARDFIELLVRRGLTPTGIVIQEPDSPPEQAVPNLLETGPQVIVAFGQAPQAAELYRVLRAAGFAGVYASPAADDPGFMDEVPFRLRNGVYGVAGWAYADDTPENAAFTRAYGLLFGKVPDALSAAAYDGATALITAIRAAGTDPAALRGQLAVLEPFTGAQGLINPGQLGGELSSNAVVFVTGPYGAPVPVARFENGQRAPLQVAGLPTPGPTQPPRPTIPPTVTPTFTPSPSHTPSRTPTATPEGVVATVLAQRLNVRTGPGIVYDIIGELTRGEQQRLIGANADFSWYAIEFRAQTAWISGGSRFVSVFGDPRTLPIIQAPPTPTLPPSPTPTLTRTPSLTPTASLTPTPQPFPDLVMLSASLNPPIPQPGQPFSLLVNVQNAGTAPAGEFAVATSFEPGAVYSAAIVPGLGPGVQTIVALNATVFGTGNFTIAIVLDLNNQVDEGPTGEANNQPTFSYRVDRPYVAQGSFQIAPVTNIDFFGGTADATYDGINLTPINGALISILPGLQLNDVHYDYLTPVVVNNALPLAQANLPPGIVMGMYTAEGQRGVLRVAGYNGVNIILEYFVYAP